MNTWWIMILTTRITMQQCVSHTSPTLTVLVKKIHTLPRRGLVTIQIASFVLCSIRFWCGFVWQVVFFLASAICKAAYLDLHWLYCIQTSISHELHIQLRFQYFLLQIPIASSLYYILRRPEFWGPNIYSPFLIV